MKDFNRNFTKRESDWHRDTFTFEVLSFMDKKQTNKQKERQRRGRGSSTDRISVQDAYTAPILLTSGRRKTRDIEDTVRVPNRVSSRVFQTSYLKNITSSTSQRKDWPSSHLTKRSFQTSRPLHNLYCNHFLKDTPLSRGWSLQYLYLLASLTPGT